MKRMATLLLALVLALSVYAGIAETEDKTITVAVCRFAQHVDWDQMYVWQKFEADTGIKVNWIYLQPEAIQEKRNLMVATDNMPDAFYGCNFTVGEVAKYGSEGLFVAVEDMLDQYAPNTAYCYKNNPSIMQAVVMPDGHIYSWPRAGQANGVHAPWTLRTAWMEALNLEMPTTPRELADVLIAMAKDDPNGNGLNDEIVYTDHSGGWYGLYQSLIGAWGLANTGLANLYYDIDPEDETQVRFWATDERFREVLELCHELYEAGALDIDSLSQDNNGWGAKLVADPPIVGALTSYIIDVYGDQNDFTAVGPLTGPYGDNMFARVNTKVSRVANYVITSSCKNIPVALEFADYWMDMGENIQRLLYGDEGVHFNWNEDKTERVFVDAIAHDPQGRSMDQMKSTFTSQPGGFFMGVMPASTLPPTSVISKAQKALEPYMPKVILEGFNFSDDELKIRNSVGVDVETFFNESVDAFITGKKDLEADWDSYVATYNDIGLESLTEIHQAAYDRYLDASN